MPSHPINVIDNNRAKRNFDQHKFNDPFPDIAPALLNPDDIKKYVDATGMIYPFYESNLKSATYGIPLYGEIHYWDNEGAKQCQELSHNNKANNVFKLEPNSIVYIQISTTFRIPYYLIFRFNLRIDLVHKGLLLGTGPVVDAGFEGKIMIPLHNLTANTYYLSAGDVLIWIEVTKLSQNPLLSDVTDENPYAYPFPEKATYQSAYDYFKKVHQNSPIKSSISDAMESTRQDAKKAKESADNSRNISIAIFFTVLGMLIMGLYYSWNLTTKYSDIIKDNQYKIETLEKDLAKINEIKK
jgi:deoxycytidine triphosphate deaminase